MAFLFTRDVFFSREDAHLHGGSSKKKEKGYAYLHPQHLACWAQVRPQEAERGSSRLPRGSGGLSVPLGPEPSSESLELGLLCALAFTQRHSEYAQCCGPPLSCLPDWMTGASGTRACSMQLRVPQAKHSAGGRELSQGFLADC